MSTNDTLADKVRMRLNYVQKWRETPDTFDNDAVAEKAAAAVAVAAATVGTISAEVEVKCTLLNHDKL